jgi:hypothetical protein
MERTLTKRRNILMFAAIALAIALGTVLATTAASGDSDHRSNKFRYEVSITNVTKGQIISPLVVATHRDSMTPVYTFGSPASPELAGVAEDADLQPFIDMLTNDPSVAEVITITGVNGPILPGETATGVINSNRYAQLISAAGMLVTTNDTFTGLNGSVLPGRGWELHIAGGYDAGSEANNEDCAYIPGPPCGNAGVRATAGAEGYVYVGNGIHGVGSLTPADFDWDNPVALIRIRRID